MPPFAPAFLQWLRCRFGGIYTPEKNRSEQGEHGPRRDRGRRIGRGAHYRYMLLHFYLVEEPPNAVKVNTAMWAFPWPVCVKSPTAFPFSAVTQLEFGVSHFFVCVHARPHPPARPSRLAKELRGGLVRRAPGYALRSAHIAPRFAMNCSGFLAHH